MISIARLLLFFVITMGYNAFLRNTVKMNRSLTWVFTFSDCDSSSQYYVKRH